MSIASAEVSRINVEVATKENGHFHLSANLVRSIQASIASGAMLPGSRLPAERAWSVELGVSRTTLRAAVKELAGMGLLDVRRNHGIFVAEPPNVETTLQRVADALILQRGPLADLFEVRIILEAQASRWAAERATAREIKRLEIAYADLREGHERGALTVEQANFMDRRLHSIVARASGNAVVLRVVDNLRALQEQSRSLDRVLTYSRIATNVGDFADIVSAIANRDGEAAYQAMASHLRRGEFDNRSVAIDA